MRKIPQSRQIFHLAKRDAYDKMTAKRKSDIMSKKNGELMTCTGSLVIKSFLPKSSRLSARI